MLSPATSIAADSQLEKMQHFNEKGGIKVRRKRDVLHFGFRIRDRDALESMNLLYERIKKAIWPDQERYPLIRRSKFNTGFKNINLWVANLGQPYAQSFRNAFEKLTKDLAEELDSVRIRFSDITCEFVEGKIFVRLRLDSESQGVLRGLQSELISRFSEFQRPGYVSLHNPGCRLLSLSTGIAFANIEDVVRQCFSELGCFEARLGPFMVCQDLEVVYQYPNSTPVQFETRLTAPEWVTRALCVSIISSRCETDPWKFIAALAVLVGFELKHDAIESCDLKIGYQKPAHHDRLVVVFRTVSLRDGFMLSVGRYLNEHDWRILACDVIEGFTPYPVHIRKALTVTEEELFALAHHICRLSLQDYRPDVDGTTLALFLRQRDAPRYFKPYYFETREELLDLINLLKYDTGTEYLSSVW